MSKPYTNAEIKLGEFYHRVKLQADSEHREFDLPVAYIQFETDRVIFEKSIKDRGLTFDELTMVYNAWSHLRSEDEFYKKSA